MAMSADQRLRSARRLRLAHVYAEYFAEDPRRERLFLASLGFFAGFGVARTITHAILHQVGPFRTLSIGGRHLHHMVFGIGGLLGVGYMWLVLLGVSPKGKRMSQATAVGYGVASPFSPLTSLASPLGNCANDAATSYPTGGQRSGTGCPRSRQCDSSRRCGDIRRRL